jgi:hypothetical protein
MLAHLVGRAGAASGKSWRAIAAEMGVSTDFLQDVREGRCIPSDVRAAILAEYFAIPAIVDIVVRLRTRACLWCGAVFLLRAKETKKLHCSEDCRRWRSNRKLHGERVKSLAFEVEVLLARNREMSSAIAANCLGCEPDGMCKTPKCVMRDVSPLPLVI